MNTYDKIIKSLEFIGLHAEGFGKSCLEVTFEIELSNDHPENSPLEFPFLKVNLNRDDKNNIVEYELIILFLSDGENDSEIFQMSDEIKNDKFGVNFKLHTYNGYELRASLGNNLRIAATIIQYYILKFAKNRKYVLKAGYSFSSNPQGNISLLIRQQNTTPFTAVRNVLSDLFKYAQYQESLYFEILRIKDYSNARDLIGNILIGKKENKDESNEYIAYLRLEEIFESDLGDSLIRFKEYKNKNCFNYAGLNCNKWETYLNFIANQIEDLVYLISDFFRMVYPHLTDDKVIVRVPYYNQTPINHSTIILNLCFYPDGSGPSENELKIASQLGFFN